MHAVWRRVTIPIFRPGLPIRWGMSELDTPAGEMEVYKAFCPTCGTLCYQKQEQWFCPTCRVSFKGVEHENS